MIASGGAARWSVLLLAVALPSWAAGALEVSATPSSVVLGTDTEVEIRITSKEADRIQARAAVGKLRLKGVDGTVALYEWTPPDVGYPHVAVLLFWVDRGPAAPDLTVLRIPLHGRTELEVTTEPAALVNVEVAGRTFGPQRADSRGHAKVPVEVPPGISTAKVLSELSGQSTQVELPLDVPRVNRLTALAGPDPVPMSGGWVWLVHAGKLDHRRGVTVDAQGAEVKASQSLPDRVLYQVKPSPTAERVRVGFRANGSPDDAARVDLATESPEKLQAKPAAPQADVRIVPTLIFGPSFSFASYAALVVDVEVAVQLKPLGTAWALGVAIEGAALTISRLVAGQGRVTSTIGGFAPMGVVRARVLEVGAFGLHVRAGVGPLLFQHQLEDPPQPTFIEGGVSVAAFVGAQASYALGPVALVFELRGSLAGTQTPQLNATLGGLGGLIGVRFP